MLSGSFWQAFREAAIANTAPVLMFAVASGLVAWIIKAIFKELLRQDTETHKARLTAQNAKSIERLRADLKLVAVEHQVRYSALHAQAAETMAVLFERLEHIYAVLQDYVMPSWGPKERQDRFPALADAYRALTTYFFPKRVFLPKDTAENVHDFIKLSRKILDEFHMIAQREAAGRVGPGPSAWELAQEEMRNRLHPLLEEIHDRFQKALGML